MDTIKLNLGCGPIVKEGYIGIDIQDFGQEIVRDITRGLPFNNDSVDEIYTSHFLEHLDGDNVLFVLSECYRVLKKDCMMYIRVPHSAEQEAFYPCHKSYWNEKMMKATCDDPAQKGKYNFEIIDMKHVGIELQVQLKTIKN